MWHNMGQINPEYEHFYGVDVSTLLCYFNAIVLQTYSYKLVEWLWRHETSSSSSRCFLSLIPEYTYYCISVYILLYICISYIYIDISYLYIAVYIFVVCPLKLLFYSRHVEDDINNRRGKDESCTQRLRWKYQIRN